VTTRPTASGGDYDLKESMGEATDIDALIRKAIQEKRLIEFRLQGLRRLAEPHLYGEYREARQLLVYQIGGESRSGNLPAWRRADLPEISELRVLDEKFAGPRVPSSRHTQWDVVLAQVE
jgi:hypothetical protein